MKYRKKLSRGTSKKRFNKGNKSSSMNRVRAMVRRGGIRL